MRFLTAAVALRPESAGAYGNLGAALMNKGQVDEAIACYQKAIELDPKYAMAHTNLGFALTRKGQVDEAIACYQKAIDTRPEARRGPQQPGHCAVCQGPGGRGHRLLPEGHRHSTRSTPRPTLSWAMH